MARNADIQYIRFSMDGNAARKLDPTPSPFKQMILEKAKKSKRRCIYVDPVAIFGIVVAVSMLITMAVGLVQLTSQRRALAQMESYVSQLQEQNAALEQAYLDSYDAQEVERTAMALGMIPKTQAPSVSLEVTLPQRQEIVSLWERIGTFLTSLFA